MKRSIAACVCMLMGAGAGAAEPAFTVRPTELKSKPFADAATLASLAESSKVDVLERQGSWRQVKAKSDTGWVRLLSLRFEANRPLATTTPYATGRSGGGSAATSAVRGFDLMAGLNRSDLAPDAAALRQVQAVDVSQAEMKAFTDAGKLAPVQFSFKPAAGAQR